MLAALDLGPFGTLAIIFAIVLAYLVIKAARAQDAKRGNLRPSARPPAMPRVQMSNDARRQPHFANVATVAPAPRAQQAATEDEDSDEAEDVAKTLAPEFVEVAHAKTLVKAEEEARPERTWLNLRDRDEVRRAFVLQEVLGKPKAARRR